MLHFLPKCSVYISHHHYCFYSFAYLYPLLLLLLPTCSTRCSVCCGKLAGAESALEGLGGSY